MDDDVSDIIGDGSVHSSLSSPREVSEQAAMTSRPETPAGDDPKFDEDIHDELAKVQSLEDVAPEQINIDSNIVAEKPDEINYKQSNNEVEEIDKKQVDDDDDAKDIQDSTNKEEDREIKEKEKKKIKSSQYEFSLVDMLSDDEGVEVKDKEEAAPEAIDTSITVTSEIVQDEEIVEAEEIPEDTESSIPADFYYDIDAMVSSAHVQEGSELPLDLLSFQHSFGYECTKRCNLHVLDEKHIVFAAGNLVQFLDLSTNEHVYLRTTGGGGVGAIAIHPSKEYVAVAEKGSIPNINIYEYPSLKLYRILRGGTETCYSSVNFSLDGKLLASQGGESDYMLTIWNWIQERTMLRCKAFSQDVHKVTFSTELQGQLTTAGSGHIRFWKMADTFTGLKLQGELGKFGKTEISDIEGYVELPDGKVLSGCEWGNILVWDGGLIKVEITRRGKKKCHDGRIEQILLDEGELITVGDDGKIKVWDFETIDTAEAADESGFYEMEPMNELVVGHRVSLKYIDKCHDPNNEQSIWYAQDARGGIWRLDLSFSHTSHIPEKLASFHAGSILAMDRSPLSHLVAITGSDGSVHIYDYLAYRHICEEHYTAAGTSLLWLPTTIDAKANSLLVGFADGIVRVLSMTLEDPAAHHKKDRKDCTLVIKQVLKPHNKSVTCLAINQDCTFLVTGGEDKTIFLLKIKETFEPLGFVVVPEAVRSVKWSPPYFNYASVLVVCDKSLIVEVDTPDLESIDTSHTYQIQNVGRRCIRMRSVKSELRHEEYLAIKAAEEEERRKAKEEEKRIRRERQLETESDQSESETESVVVEEEVWEPYIPNDPSNILDVCFDSEPDRIWISMGDYDAGYLYNCEFTQKMVDEGQISIVDVKPVKTIKMLETNDVPITKFLFSQDGVHVLMGMADGVIRIQEMGDGDEESDDGHDLDLMGSFWQLNMHDCKYGQITSLITSHDGNYVLSCGADGNLFLYALMSKELLEEKVAEARARLPSIKTADAPSVDDIKDEKAYSIEEAKQKTEYDKMVYLAEQKKIETRRSIAKLRRSFKALLEQNDTLPAHLQLPRKAFVMDEQIQKQLMKKTADRIENVKLEMGWEAEKHRLAMEKLRLRFKEMVQCEKIRVKAFKSNHEVSSFRLYKLMSDFYVVKEELIKRKITTFDKQRDVLKDVGKGAAEDDDANKPVEQAESQQEAKTMTSLKGSMADRIHAALMKVEANKKKRALRKAQWDALYKSQPDDGWEDPADVAAIKEAQENMGDFKLKTADDYVVPDHLRMNVEKAKLKLITLKEQIHNAKNEFNICLLALRDDKIRIIEEIRNLTDELKQVQVKLHPDYHQPIPVIPEMLPREIPEKKLLYTKEDLLKFKKDMETKTNESQMGDSGGKFSIAMIGKVDVATKRVVKDSNIVEVNKSVVSDEFEHVSEMERELYEIEQIELSYKQNKLLEKISSLIVKFDIDLRILRHEKFKLRVTLKNADLRHVTVYEELMLLKEFEKSENVLAEKVDQKIAETRDMEEKLNDCKMKLETKKKEIEKIQSEEKTHLKKFQESLGDNNKFVDYLTKVFKKRIKRSKKKATEDSDEESDEESDDDSDYIESDEESDEEGAGYDLDVCPSGCDQQLYDNTCALRETRLDIEEKLTEERKMFEALRKELDGLQKKSKVIEAALKAAENSLEAFQLEKQRKINDLDVVVTLKLHQIQHIVNGSLPSDLSPTLVVEAATINNLQLRIKELEHEKAEQRKQMNESNKNKKELEKNKRLMQSRLTSMDEECNEIMCKKFGCIVDIEKLEGITVNRTIEELKEKLRILEINCASELNAWDNKLTDKRSQIDEHVSENTSNIKLLTMLLEEKLELEEILDDRHKHLGQEYQGESKQDIEERHRLIQLLHLQMEEINSLKHEIHLLTHKGGHILPPTQPPMPPKSSNKSFAL